MISKLLNHGRTLALRLEVGEEIVGSVLAAAKQYSVASGTVSGSARSAPPKSACSIRRNKSITKRRSRKPLEIASLVGNLSTKDGEPYAHLHIVLGDIHGHTYGGHLSSGVIGATAEILYRSFRTPSSASSRMKSA